MSNKLNGVWKFKTSENFDKYMESIGVSFATRKVGSLTKPTVTITTDGKSFRLRSENTFRNFETKCTIGEEFDEETPDGRKCKSVMTMDGDKLVHTQKWDGKETSITRYVDDNGVLLMDCVFGDIVCKRSYTKSA